MRVSDFARQLGRSADWVRKAEKAGRIPPAPRDVNGHRYYKVEDVQMVRSLLLPSGEAIEEACNQMVSRLIGRALNHSTMEVGK